MNNWIVQNWHARRDRSHQQQSRLLCIDVFSCRLFFQYLRMFLFEAEGEVSLFLLPSAHLESYLPCQLSSYSFTHFPSFSFSLCLVEFLLSQVLDGDVHQTGFSSLFIVSSKVDRCLTTSIGSLFLFLVFVLLDLSLSFFISQCLFWLTNTLASLCTLNICHILFVSSLASIAHLLTLITSKSQINKVMSSLLLLIVWFQLRNKYKHFCH